MRSKWTRRRATLASNRPQMGSDLGPDVKRPMGAKSPIERLGSLAPACPEERISRSPLWEGSDAACGPSARSRLANHEARC